MAGQVYVPHAARKIHRRSLSLSLRCCFQHTKEQFACAQLSNPAAATNYY
jgi:hypothetical protein